MSRKLDHGQLNGTPGAPLAECVARPISGGRHRHAFKLTVYLDVEVMAAQLEVEAEEERDRERYARLT